MPNNEHTNEANKQFSPPHKPTSSTKTTHGSLTSKSGGSGHGHNEGGSSQAHGASTGNNQRSDWAMQQWLQQTPRDEPWRAGSRKA